MVAHVALVTSTPSALAVVESVPGERNPAMVYLTRLAEGSRRSQRQALDTLASMLTGGAADAVAFDWSRIGYQHTQALRAALTERYAPATVNRYLAALRGVLGECWRLGIIGAEDYHRAIDVKGVRGQGLPAGRALAAGEIRALFGACGPDAGGARNAAMVAVLYGCGLRRSELVALNLADFDQETGALTVRHGKGNKARTVYVTNGGRAALEDWIAVRGAAAGALFCPVDRMGRVSIRPITTQAVYVALRALAERSGVREFSPHDLRRSMISDALDAGADIATVQRLAGHAAVTTTQRYDRRGESVKLAAASLLHVPYVRREAAATTRSGPGTS